MRDSWAGAVKGWAGLIEGVRQRAAASEQAFAAERTEVLYWVGGRGSWAGVVQSWAGLVKGLHVHAAASGHAFAAEPREVRCRQLGCDSEGLGWASCRGAAAGSSIGIGVCSRATRGAVLAAGLG